jgi:hypothetical protein
MIVITWGEERTPTNRLELCGMLELTEWGGLFNPPRTFEFQYATMTKMLRRGEYTMPFS